jgi:hypothetical protein
MTLAASLVPKNGTEPLYQNSLVDEQGRLQQWARNWFEGKGRQVGEIISGVDRNAQNIVQLEADYQAADGVLSTAYIAADAVVASDAAAARAVITTEIEAARDGEASLLAKFTAVETAYAAGDAAEASARASLQATLEAADTTLQANIDSEESARVSGDSANSTSIQTVEARLAYRMPTDFENLAEEYSQALSGAPGSVADDALYSNSDGVATVTLTGAIKGLYVKGLFRNVEGETYKLIVKWRVTGTTEPSGTNCMLIAFQSLNSSYSSVSARGFIIDTYDGTSDIRTSEISWTANGSDVWLRPRIEFRGDMVDGTGEILDINIIGPDNDTALTSVLQDAFVNSAGEAIAKIVLEAAASGGNPARIGLRDGSGGSDIALDADEIHFGSDTTFEDTNDTFYTEDSGDRYRFSGPFGSSSDLLMWFGPTSVSLNSETKTNGYFALATDGKVYYGADELAGGQFTASYAGSWSNTSGAAANFSSSTSVNTDGLSGGKTYFTQIVDVNTLTPKTSVTSPTSSSPTLQATGFSVSESESGTIQTTVTDTTTGRTTTVQAAFTMTRTS